MGRLGVLNRRMVRALYDMGRKVLVVGGLPGGGKTRTTMRFIQPLARQTKVVYAAPLRKIRDFVAREYDGEVIKGKAEVCHRLRHLDEEGRSIFEYVLESTKICAGCDMASGCPFRDELAPLLEEKRGLFCVTTKLLYNIVINRPDAFKDAVVVIDEAEQWLDLFEYVCSHEALVALFRAAKTDPSAKMAAVRLLRSTIRVGKTLRFMKPVMPAARMLVLVSATLPNQLLALLPLPRGYSIFRAVVSAPMNDDFFLVPRYAAWMDDAPRGYVPRRVWVPALVSLALEAYDSGKSVGIASRNYELTRELTAQFMEVGARVYSDVVSEQPPPYSIEGRFIVIWTTRGRWYRGTSLPDTDVVICTYQSISEATKVLPAYIATELDIPYAKIMNACVNTQSYFRSNRQRGRRHEVVFFDKRAQDAMATGLSHYRTAKWFKRLLEPEIITLY